MKTQLEIEHLAIRFCNTWAEHYAFIEGYYQGQKDMKKSFQDMLQGYTLTNKKLKKSNYKPTKNKKQ
jgi:hypothetical protein